MVLNVLCEADGTVGAISSLVLSLSEQTHIARLLCMVLRFGLKAALEQTRGTGTSASLQLAARLEQLPVASPSTGKPLLNGMWYKCGCLSQIIK